MEQYTSTKAQVWYTDFVVALMIFTVGFLIYLNATSDILDKEDDEFGSIVNDVNRISSVFLSQGYPPDWDNETVELIGISLNNRINQTKLLRAANISYDKSRTLLSTRHEYFVFLKDKDDNILNLGGVCGIGKNNMAEIISEKLCSNLSLNAEKLAKSERTVIFKSEIAKMGVYVWE